MTPPPTAAALRERVSDSAYGEAQHHFPGDLDGDGDVDSADTGAKKCEAKQAESEGGEAASESFGLTALTARGSMRRWKQGTVRWMHSDRAPEALPQSLQ
jgi:hypothetical protein